MSVLSPNLWDELAASLHVRRVLVKQWVHVLLYNGHIDPWVDHLLTEEIYRRAVGTPLISGGSNE